MEYEGVLRIDEDRGVIYFCCGKGDMGGRTLLRIQALPIPIPLPNLEDPALLDIRWGLRCSWDKRKGKR